jgi:c(7)-type cytochrome triheme protein
MHNHGGYLIALFFIGFSLSCFSQDSEQAGQDANPQAPITTRTKSGLPDEITFPSERGDVMFPHKLHVKEQKLKCATCHHQIRAIELETPHPDYLETARVNCHVCHEVESAASQQYYQCAKCHYSQPKDYADETLSAKVVIHKNCWKCHDQGTGAEVSARCDDCHQQIGE